MDKSAKLTEITLDQMQDGQSGTIMRVWLEGSTKRRLIEMGVTPGATLRVTKRAPLGDPIEIHLRGYTLTLRADDARRIGVRPEGVTT